MMRIKEIEFPEWMNFLRVRKIRTRKICGECQKVMPKGTWCLGEGRYYKICLDCAKNKTYPRAKKQLKKWIEIANQTEKQLNKNWDKYTRENTLANLQDGE